MRNIDEGRNQINLARRRSRLTGITDGERLEAELETKEEQTKHDLRPDFEVVRASEREENKVGHRMKMGVQNKRN